MATSVEVIKNGSTWIGRSDVINLGQSFKIWKDLDGGIKSHLSFSRIEGGSEPFKKF